MNFGFGFQECLRFAVGFGVLGIDFAIAVVFGAFTNF